MNNVKGLISPRGSEYYRLLTFIKIVLTNVNMCVHIDISIRGQILPLNGKVNITLSSFDVDANVIIIIVLVLGVNGS